ncbi:CaaX protease [Pleurostoma richardsiae]|uniref:intramembrane prenyl-peptidase Rce1 n=1 Tax=Pleurostoma richardsiae TaxID=41990 RepID=A0AA38VH51_9PEZI|nr:CaaX protease [Pleurostoma richardsiae]
MPSARSLLADLFHGKTETPPALTTHTAVILLVAYTVSYVVPFYLLPTTRPSATISRDAPSVIRTRITLVSATCFVCSVATFLILTKKANTSFQDAAHSMGYWPLGLLEAVRSLLLTALLFLGPLFETLVVCGGWRNWLSLGPMKELLDEWTTWRNIVAGPVTEEILFRSASVPLMLTARTSAARTVFLSPVIFGLAHIHHFYEFRLTHPKVPVFAGILRSVLQFSFTTLFGAYATFLFLRTGSLVAICLVHAFCNSMGLPRLWGHVQPGGVERTNAKTKGVFSCTIAYYILLVAGATLWCRNLWSLTESSHALIAM